MITVTNLFANMTKSESVTPEENFLPWLQQMFASPDFIKMTLEFEEQTVTWEKVED